MSHFPAPSDAQWIMQTAGGRCHLVDHSSGSAGPGFFLENELIERHMVENG